MEQYEAFWIPGLDDPDYWDDCIYLGIEWLEAMRLPGVLVLDTIGSAQNRPELADAATQYDLVAPRSRHRWRGYAHGPYAVLAVWPNGPTLELAESIAHGGALCVVPGTRHEIVGWIAKTSASNWVADDTDAIDTTFGLGPEVVDTLQFVARFDGHNNLRGAGGKETTIRVLRAMVAKGHQPDPGDVEQFMAAQPEMKSSTGALRAREWYEGILAGKTFRGYNGRPL